MIKQIPNACPTAPRPIAAGIGITNVWKEAS